MYIHTNITYLRVYISVYVCCACPCTYAHMYLYVANILEFLNPDIALRYASD